MSEQVIELSNLRTAEEIRGAFEALRVEEDKTEAELENLLNSHRYIEVELKELLQNGQFQMGKLENDVQDMSKRIGYTASLADGVSAKVKQLDLAKNRVYDCQQRVNDLIDLRLCADGVKQALNEENYEKAAAHLHRYLNMNEAQLKATAERMSEGGANVSLDNAISILHNGEDQVRRVVSHRFDEAIKNDDLASIERFFKLFPLINLHDVGLKKFSLYLHSKLAANGEQCLKTATGAMPGDPRSNVIFADTLTMLFEGIARTVEVHQPLIETYYGPGKVAQVLHLLQEECDRQASKIFLEFKKKRSVKDKVDKIRDSIYGTSSLEATSNSLTVNKLEARELGHILEEMALLQSRSEMYFRFVKMKSSSDEKDVEKVDIERQLLTCGLSQSVQELMSEYIMLEEYYMTQNIGKAMHQFKESSIDVEKILDDIFFIVKQCVTRSIGCANLDGLCAVANNACSILETEFANVLHSQLKMGFPSGYLDMTMNVIQTSFQQGYKKAAALQAGIADTESQKTIFLSSLNCADQAVDYITRLIATLQGETRTLLSGKSQHDKEKVENSFSGFPALIQRFKAIIEQGMQQLRQSVIKPRIKPWMDAFPSHDIDEDTFADYEANDPFVQTLIMNLDSLLVSFRESLTTTNFETWVGLMAIEVTLQLEKTSLKSGKFSRLGGLQFDREVRSLVSYFTSTSSWSMRENFARLSQIATILNIESVDEMKDFNENWKLTSSEIKQILSLRYEQMKFLKDTFKNIPFYLVLGLILFPKTSKNYAYNQMSQICIYYVVVIPFHSKFLEIIQDLKPKLD